MPPAGHLRNGPFSSDGRRTEPPSRRPANCGRTPGSCFTTHYGTPVEPRDFNREFAARSAKSAYGSSACMKRATPAGHCSPRSTCTRKIGETMEIYPHVPSESTRKGTAETGQASRQPGGSTELLSSLPHCTRKPPPDLPGGGFDALWTVHGWG
ncbi:hypothetical protein GCM10012285_51130 [Streptomyces kronopolitis]|uniref:Uncharacterized protein n=1 Tax=Streptomyces kronopolitis TaxID=1612435 RepID=A0ABQ2JT35_9ACTN|nr:hypothetical protein GCM10012285_51130 [Streptomyces kronopolitis]